MGEDVAVSAPLDEIDPPLDYPDYRSTALRAPKRPLVVVPDGFRDLAGPVFGHDEVGELDHDLTRQHSGEPLGERITVGGRVLDEGGRPVPNALVEVWQANAGGRYRHDGDRHPAPLDPNFSGAGRTLTDDEGRYEFVTIKPGAYPWQNHPNAWRPAHIHFSLFGRAFSSRLVTQMYFRATRCSNSIRSSSRCETRRRGSAWSPVSSSASRSRSGRSATASTSSCARRPFE